MIAGDVEAVRRGADDLRSAARQLAIAADGLEDDALAATRGWAGAGADAALAGLVRLGNHGRIGAEVLTRCGDVLAAFADELAVAQRQVTDAQVGFDRAQTGRQALGPLVVGTAMRRLQVERVAADAQHLLDAATVRVQHAGAAAAARIRSLTVELTGMVPPPPAPPPARSSIVGWVHGGLDVVGLLPVFGEPADLVNGVLYALEGDKLNAGLSMAAVVPGAGAAATGGKLARKTAQAAADAEKAAEAATAAARAAQYGHQPGAILPGASQATIPPAKVREYSLNPDHTDGGHKARVLRAATGFDLSTADELERQVLEGIRHQPAVLHLFDKHGQRFTVDMPVIGPSGRAIVRTGWIIKDPGDSPRLTSLYIP